MTRLCFSGMVVGIGLALAALAVPFVYADSDWRAVSRTEAAQVVGAGDLCSDWEPSICSGGSSSDPDPDCNLENCQSPVGPNPNGTAPDGAEEDWCGEEDSPCGKISHSQDPCNEE